MARPGILEFKYHGWRLCNLALELELSELASFPLEIQLEVTTACNLRCAMCTRTWNRPTARHMSSRVLEKILPILPSATRLVPFGGGEPLLYPRFLELIESAKEAGVVVSFNTNGTLLTPELAKRFASLGVDAIAFSMDGASKRIYEDIRRRASFGKVLRHLEFLCSERERQGTGKPQVIVAFVPLRNNVDDLPRLITLCSQVGVHDVCFEPLIEPGPDWNPGYRNFYAENALSSVPRGKLSDLADRCEALAREGRVNLHPPGFFDSWRSEQSSPNAVCTISEGALGAPPRDVRDASPQGAGVECTLPWTSIYVSVSGDVHTCCMSARVFGNLEEQSFAEIWNGAPFRDYREAILQRSFPGECSVCLANARGRREIPDCLRPPRIEARRDGASGGGGRRILRRWLQTLLG